MLRLSQIKLNIKHTEEELRKSILKLLKISPDKLVDYRIIKKSVDARKKQEIKYIYSIDVNILEEEKIIKKQLPNVSQVKEKPYEIIADGEETLKYRPIVIGTGPAGIFCALMLAEQGFHPIIVERGAEVNKRVDMVENFWNVNELNTDSNVQFGEGGAGTFSDGKLNTLVKDPEGRNRKVLETFVKYGGPEDILYLNKPHIGTDKLRDVICNMRKQLIALGGEVRFETKAEDFIIEDNKITGIEVISTHDGEKRKEILPCEVVVMAIGHSARDTFSKLFEKNLNMTAKSFAIGVRIEHPQQLISENQYGTCYKELPPADYKLTHQAKNGRSIYSFCMCPGGFVVNASSECERLTVNGMSNYDRGERNANSALIVTVTPKDFNGDSPLAGMEFQRKWEHQAFLSGKGLVPIQLLGDLKQNRTSTALGHIIPNIKGGYSFANIRECLPDYIIETLMEGLDAFDKKIQGFADEEAILSGIEARTSSPIRIVRDEFMESNIKGIYPCGEGAGYAGGITSAAMDGMKVAAFIAHKYKPQ